MLQVNDAQLLVLCVLVQGPLHGYAINTAIENLTGNRLGPGSLYGALSRLQSKGLIEPLDGNGRQHPVRLTPEGRTLLEQQLRTMAHVAGVGLRGLGVTPA